MPLVYKYEFENENGVKCSVSFYDKQYNIIDAESLAQISSLYRRAWAQTIIAEMDPIGLMPLSDTSSYHLDDPFAARLRAENWGQSYASLIRSNTHFWLQIYRFYLFNCLSI